jgi:hypothetical protein
MLAGTLAAMAIAASPAWAAGSRLGTPEVITSFGGESNLLSVSSAPGHPDAYAVFHRKIGANVYSVVHRDSHGHAHRFDIHRANGTFPYAIRLVALEGGAGMALWDDSANSRVLARSWSAKGQEGETRVVLSGVDTVHSAENDFAQWEVRADGHGTVVVASIRGSSVIAAIRDPGGAFRPQQEVTPPGEPSIDQRQFDISPIAPDGTVTVSWGPDFGDGAGGQATRHGRTPRFNPPTAAPFTSEPPITRGSRSVFATDGTAIYMTPRLARICPCLRPHVFRWGPRGEVRAIAIMAVHGGYPTYGRAWYVAGRNADAAYDHPVKATEHTSSAPIRRKRPGEVGFARFDTSTDYNLFRQRSRLIVIPFGPRVPRSRRAPRLRFGTYVRVTKAGLFIPVYCDRVSLGKRMSAHLEPFTVVYLRVSPPHRKAISVGATAVDNAGHRVTIRGAFVRAKRATSWCLAGSSRC